MTPKGDKWRPSLGLVVFAVLSTVMALPLIGLFFFRLYDNQLIHQTQAELIAQSKVLAAIYAREVDARLPGIPLGRELAEGARPNPADNFAPIRPELDLAGNDLLARRPEARAANGDLDQSIGMSPENTLIVLSHLVDNASHHSATEVNLAASTVNGVVKVNVRNNGEDISEHNRDRIFDAFFTTRRDTGGTGMGLAIVQSMLRTNGGTIALARSESGVTFEIEFAAG